MDIDYLFSFKPVSTKASQHLDAEIQLERNRTTSTLLLQQYEKHVCLGVRPQISRHIAYETHHRCPSLGIRYLMGSF